MSVENDLHLFVAAKRIEIFRTMESQATGQTKALARKEQVP